MGTRVKMLIAGLAMCLPLAACDSPDDPPQAVGQVQGCTVYKLTTSDYRTLYVSKCSDGSPSGVAWMSGKVMRHSVTQP
jgi:hypothetical protein